MSVPLRVDQTQDRLAALGLDPARLPRHIAVIMDGNGRWARRRGLPRVLGHRRGVDSVRAVIEECCRLGIGQLTLYCLSSENWKRPRNELNFLMSLLWQISYAELWVTQVFWPDFREANLHEALRDYASRGRRFGGLDRSC